MPEGATVDSSDASVRLKSQDLEGRRNGDGGAQGWVGAWPVGAGPRREDPFNCRWTTRAELRLAIVT